MKIIKFELIFWSVALFVTIICLGYACSNSPQKNDCNQSTESPEPASTYQYDDDFWSSVEYDIEEKTIDSCEYIIIIGIETSHIIHKANCNNHPYNK